jgi:hypothetical protein
MAHNSKQFFHEPATPLLLVLIQIWVWWPLLSDGPTWVHLRVFPSAVRVAASQESHHIARFWGAAICEVSLLSIRIVFPWLQHEGCYVYWLDWWVLLCVDNATVSIRLTKTVALWNVSSCSLVACVSEKLDVSNSVFTVNQWVSAM